MPTQAIESAFKNYALLGFISFEQEKLLESFKYVLKKIHLRSRRIIPEHINNSLSFQILEYTGNDGKRKAKTILTLVFAPERNGILVVGSEPVMVLNPKDHEEVENFINVFFP